jgi:hypothetical protein
VTTGEGIGKTSNLPPVREAEQGATYRSGMQLKAQSAEAGALSSDQLKTLCSLILSFSA